MLRSRDHKLGQSRSLGVLDLWDHRSDEETCEHDPGLVVVVVVIMEEEVVVVVAVVFVVVVVMVVVVVVVMMVVVVVVVVMVVVMVVMVMVGQVLVQNCAGRRRRLYGRDPYQHVDCDGCMVGGFGVGF